MNFDILKKIVLEMDENYFLCYEEILNKLEKEINLLKIETICCPECSSLCKIGRNENIKSLMNNLVERIIEDGKPGKPGKPD